MDIQDPDYYSANTFVCIEVGDITQKKETRKKSGQLTVCSETPLSYRNQSIDLSCKSIDWFLYDASFYWKVFSNRL